MNINLECRKRIINELDKIVKPYQYFILKIFRNTVEKFTIVLMLFKLNYFFKKIFVVILPLQKSKLKLINPEKVPILTSITIENKKIVIIGKNFENVKCVYFDDIEISTFYWDQCNRNIIYISLPVEDMIDTVLNGFFKVSVKNEFGFSLEKFEINI